MSLKYIIIHSDMKKYITIFILIAVITTLLLTTGFIFANLEHDCSKDDCPLCLQINEAGNLLRIIAAFAGNAFLAFFFPVFFAIYFNTEDLSEAKYTLVDLKVRLNN